MLCYTPYFSIEICGLAGEPMRLSFQAVTFVGQEPPSWLNNLAAAGIIFNTCAFCWLNNHYYMFSICLLFISMPLNSVCPLGIPAQGLLNAVFFVLSNRQIRWGHSVGVFNVSYHSHRKVPQDCCCPTYGEVARFSNLLKVIAIARKFS